MSRHGTGVRTHWAALRLLAVFTVAFGAVYPLAVTAVAQVPGLHHRAEGSLIHDASGTLVGSSLIGQMFTDASGNALVQYLQSRPSAAGHGYDPTATSASNLGPESIIDALPNPTRSGDSGTQSLLTQVCARSYATGALEGVDGARPFCSPSGVGAVLAVFHAGPGYAGPVVRAVSINETCNGGGKPFVSTYQGVTVECGHFGEDYTSGQVVPVRGRLPAPPVVPADAVTASGSGLDPEISPAYADLQAARVATARRIPLSEVQAVIAGHRAGRDLGFLGEPGVNVLAVNEALDQLHPYPGTR